MLKGISPLFSPELLSAIYTMGHGEELVLGDAHFPAHDCNDYIIRADGIFIAPLLDAILPLFVVDLYVDDPLVMMAAVGDDTLDPAVEKAYLVPIKKYAPNAPAITRLDKPAFYERSRRAFAVVATGETAKYGNIIIKKDVTPV